MLEINRNYSEIEVVSNQTILREKTSIEAAENYARKLIHLLISSMPNNKHCAQHIKGI